MKIKLSRKDIIWGYFAQFFSIASGIIMLPIVLRLLKPDEIGMNYLMLTVGSMVALFDFGFAPQFARNITYIFSGAQVLKKEGIDINEDEKKEVNYRLLSTMIHTSKLVYSLLSLIVLVVMLTLGTFYIYKVTNGFTSVHNALLIWIVYSVSTFINIYYTYYTSLLTGKGMVMESKKAMVYSKIIYIIIAIVLLMMGMGLLGIAIANLVSPLFNRYISYHYFFTADLKEKINAYHVTKAEKIDLFNIIWYNSKKIGLVYVSGYAITKFSMFLAGLYLSLPNIASYGLMMQFVGIISTLSGTLFILSEPRLSSLKIKGEKEMLLKSFSYTMGIYYLLFIFMAAAFLFIAPWLLTLLKSNIILPSAGIMILYLIIILLELNHSFFATMIVIGNTVPFMGVSLITGGCIALLSFVSLEFTNLGILGLVLVQGIVQLAYSNWKWPQVICKEFKINFITFLRTAFTEVYIKQKEYYHGRSKHGLFSNNR
jgi:O-antigen/teichoic acid export membrane protein